MKKRITLSLTLALSVVAVVLAATVIFSGGSRALPTDSENSFASEAIIFACKNGYMSCTMSDEGEALFVPDGTITRAEFAQIIVDFLGINPDKYFRTETNFADMGDVPEELIPYVKTVAALGLMGTLSENGKLYFMPLENVSRQETAYMLGALIGASVSTFKTDMFSDFETTYKPYSANVKTMISYEYMIGYPDRTFRPERDITRAELALTLYRLKQGGEKLIY